MVLYNVNRDQKERANKLMLFYASEPEEVSVLSFGSVGVILGLKHTRTGDTLVSGSGRSDSRPSDDEHGEDGNILREITPPRRRLIRHFVRRTHHAFCEDYNRNLASLMA